MSNFHNIKREATHYSEQIKQLKDSLQEVTIAGKITSIVPPLCQGESDVSNNYLLKLDDEVGEITVYVSQLMKSHYDFIEIGNNVVFHGFVHVLQRRVSGKIKRDHSVYAFEDKESYKALH